MFFLLPNTRIWRAFENGEINRIICHLFIIYCVESKKYTGTIYAQTWFKLWVNGKEVKVDPVLFNPGNAVKVSFDTSE